MAEATPRSSAYAGPTMARGVGFQHVGACFSTSRVAPRGASARGLTSATGRTPKGHSRKVRSGFAYAEAFEGGVADYDLKVGRVARTKRQLAIIGEDESFPATPEAWTSRIHPDERHMFIQARQAVIDGEASHFEAEYRLRHRDGRWVWVWHRGMAMHDSSGELDRIISSMIEVTARKHAEDALRESEARFRHLADSAPAFIWLTNEKGDLTFVNRHFEHVFDRSAES